MIKLISLLSLSFLFSFSSFSSAHDLMAAIQSDDRSPKNVSTVILGASDMTQLENNLKSLDYLKNFDDADLTEALRKI